MSFVLLNFPSTNQNLDIEVLVHGSSQFPQLSDVDFVAALL